MSRISGNRPARRGGFTLVEILVATSVSAIVMAGLLSAYLFLGRNLKRLTYYHAQESDGRRTIQQFSQDVSSAILLTTASSTTIALTKPISTGNSTVTYTWNGTAGGNFTRTQDSGPAVTMLKYVTSLSMTFYDGSGNTPSGMQPYDVKNVELVFATVRPSPATVGAAGTITPYTSATSRILLRNRQPLQ
jgi:prepilin-type N-terminal cleavage/methylation domain-containing protein